MSWVKAQFSSLFLEPTRNGIYKAADSHGSGCKIINMGEIFGYSFIGGQDMSRITVDEAELQRFHVKAGDLLFARRSLVESGAGKCSIVNVINESIVFESSIIRVRLNQAIADPLFYMYWMRSLAGRTAIGAIVTGLNVKGIRSSDLSNIEVEVPPLETQKAISSILRSYDELIETYQKQIKSLEEAALRLYKEWFVDLRFPGHESAKIVDGIPEGWSFRTLGELTTKFATGLNPRKNFVLGKGSNYYVTIKNMANNRVVFDDKCDRVDNDALVKINRRSDLQQGDLLFSGIGTIGRVAMIDKPVQNWNISESVFTMRPIQSISSVYLFLMMLNDDIQSYCQANAHGCAQKGIRMADLKAYKTLIAPQELMDSFTRIVTPYISASHKINDQILHLTEARDRLLPKLMSREIEVK